MKQFVYFFLIFFLLCIALTGSFSNLLIIYCAFISLLAAIVTVFVFKVYVKVDVSLIKLITFFLLLVKSIYVSTFVTLWSFFKSKFRLYSNAKKVTIKTRGGLQRLLICQAITLTPGTVSVKSKTGSITVLKFENDSLDSVAKFDRALRKKQ